MHLSGIVGDLDDFKIDALETKFKSLRFKSTNNCIKLLQAFNFFPKWCIQISGMLRSLQPHCPSM